MSKKRLLSRIPAVRTGVAVLQGYRLCFTKPGEFDGSAKCDIFRTGNPEDAVYGVVYIVLEEHMHILDAFEGLGYGYSNECVTVVMNGESIRATTYMALNRDNTLKPYSWYKRHVLAGALENGLPEEYINTIEAVESKEDPDDSRHARELSIYADSADHV